MIELDYNKNTSKLQIRGDKDVFDRLREHFSTEDSNISFKRRRNRFIRSSRKYIITESGQCNVGFYWEINRYLIKNQINNVVKTDNLVKAINNSKPGELYQQFKYSLRDYQVDVLNRALTIGRGICVLGTGGGKTFTVAALIENYYRNSNNRQLFKCLLVVPDLGLVSQTYDEFNECGVSFTFSKWTGSHDIDITSNVIICNSGVLQSRFDKSEWVKYVDLLVVDECHKIQSGNKISKLLNKIKTCRKFGVTGTLPDDQFEKWSIISRIGPVIYEKSSHSLRSENYLVNVEVKLLNLRYKTPVPRLTDNEYRDELDFLYKNTQRNNVIYRLCSKLTNNTLILVNHIEHGKVLYESLSKLNEKQVYFIRGEIEVEERDKIKQIMEENTNIVCIAISAIFSTGVNIKNLHYIVFAAGGKSFIRVVQSIGRGLRLHESKKKLVIFDIADQLHYGMKHSLKRTEIYSKEKINFSESNIDLS